MKQTISNEMLTAAAMLLHMSIPELQSKLTQTPAQNAKEPRDRLLTIDEAGEMLTVVRRTIHDYIKKGILRPVRLAAGHRRGDGRIVGGRLGIPLSQIQAIIAGTVDIVAMRANSKQEVH